MAEKNGNVAWIRYLVGLIVTLVVIVAIPAIVKGMVENDRMSRERDSVLREDFNNHCLKAEEQFHDYAMKQETYNGEMKAFLREMAKDIEYIKSK